LCTSFHPLLVLQKREIMPFLFSSAVRVQFCLLSEPRGRDTHALICKQASAAGDGEAQIARGTPAATCLFFILLRRPIHISLFWWCSNGAFLID